MSEASIPPGWAIEELGEICEILDSRRIPINATERNQRISGKSDSELFPYFGATGEVGKIDGYLFDGEYVLIGEDAAPFLEPHRGVSYLVSGKFWVNNHAHILHHPTSNRFLCYYLRQIDYRPFITGTTRLKLNQARMRKIPLPLPPLAEQKRIVAKIEELFSELDAGEESLRRARRQLGVYRQSLLKQAFEGKLTAPLPGRQAGWRAQHPDLLEDWSWLTLQDIADVTGGLTKNSKRDNFPTRIPYLRVANVYANELRLDEIKDIGVTPEEAKKVRLAKGDLLIVEGNGSLDQIGRVARWDGSIPDCGHQNHLIRARCRDIANPAFVLMFLLSPRGRELIEKQAASTSGLHTLSVSKVQRLPVPLCSLPEQQEIVRLLDSQFEVIEQNEREIDAALKRSEALRQSILKKAFTGQLVPPACRQAGKTPEEFPQPKPGKWWVYVIRCDDGSFYKGFTDDLPKRWRRHLAGNGAKWTKQHPPVELFYWEEHWSEASAVERERYLKSGSGREWFQREIVANEAEYEPASTLLARIREAREVASRAPKRKTVRVVAKPS